MPNGQLYLDKLEGRESQLVLEKVSKKKKIEPREYQIKAVEETIGSMFISNNNQIVIEAPTGSGKSYIITELTRQLVQDHDMKVAIVVNITALIDQIAEHLHALDLEYSILKAGYEDRFDQSKMIQLIMSQTLYARVDKLNIKTDVIIQDEAHKEWNTKRTMLVQKHLGNRYRIGLSATPYDNKGYALEGVDHIVKTVSIKELEEKGFLTPVRYFVPKFALEQNYDELKVSSTGDYSESDIDNIVLKKEFQEAAIKAMIQQGIKDKKSIVFCNSIKHAEIVAKALVENGVEAYPYHSNQSKEEADEIMAKFKQPGSKIALCSINKISIGFDVQDIELGVSLRRTMVRSLWIQQVGRLCRTAKGKRYAELLDIAGNLEIHGFHYEQYIPPVKGDKEALIKEQAKHRIDILREIVRSEEPSEITKELVLEKIKEIKEQQTNIEKMPLEKLMYLFDILWDIRGIIEVGFEISYRVHDEQYNETSIDWASSSWLDLVKRYPEYEKMIVKALKTMLKNKIKKGSKAKGIYYSAKWLEQNNDTLIQARMKKNNLNEEEIPF